MKQFLCFISACLAALLAAHPDIARSAEVPDARYQHRVTGLFSPCQPEVLVSTFTSTVNTWLRRHKATLVSRQDGLVSMKARYKFPQDIHLLIENERFTIVVHPSAGTDVKAEKATSVSEHLATGILSRMQPELLKIPSVICSPFVSEDHLTYQGTGDSVVSGQAFLRQNGGGVVTCAGSQVMLLPATPYFREVIALSRRDRPMPSLPGDALAFTKSTTCDAQGNFRFSNVPNNRWIVVTLVSWNVAHVEQGGLLSSEVETSGAQPMEILLTDRHRVSGI